MTDILQQPMSSNANDKITQQPVYYQHAGETTLLKLSFTSWQKQTATQPSAMMQKLSQSCVINEEEKNAILWKGIHQIIETDIDLTRKIFQILNITKIVNNQFKDKPVHNQFWNNDDLIQSVAFFWIFKDILNFAHTSTTTFKQSFSLILTKSITSDFYDFATNYIRPDHMIRRMAICQQLHYDTLSDRFFNNPVHINSIFFNKLSHLKNLILELNTNFINEEIINCLKTKFNNLEMFELDINGDYNHRKFLHLLQQLAANKFNNVKYLCVRNSNLVRRSIAEERSEVTFHIHRPKLVSNEVITSNWMRLETLVLSKVRIAHFMFEWLSQAKRLQRLALLEVWCGWEPKEDDIFGYNAARKSLQQVLFKNCGELKELYLIDCTSIPNTLDLFGDDPTDVFQTLNKLKKLAKVQMKLIANTIQKVKNWLRIISTMNDLLTLNVWIKLKISKNALVSEEDKNTLNQLMQDCQLKPKVSLWLTIDTVGFKVTDDTTSFNKLMIGIKPEDRYIVTTAYM